MSARDFDFLHGSWRIAHRYLTERLAGCDEWSGMACIDELVLWVHPVMAGAGTYIDMLFSDGLNARLALLDAKTLASGVVILTYRPS